MNNIIILMTPFHKLSVQAVFPGLFEENSTILFVSDYVNQGDLNCKIEKLNGYNFNKKFFFKKPLKYYLETKKQIKKIKKEARILVKKHNISSPINVIIGSDKDIFTQLFLNYLYSNNLIDKLILVDEGTGLYRSLAFKDTIFKFFYQLGTRLFLNEELYYVKRLGVHPKINTIYLRALDLLPKKVDTIEYKEFSLNTKFKDERINSLGSILLYSFPNQDIQIEDNFKIGVIKSIAKNAKKSNKKVYVKPHPREDFLLLKKELKTEDNVVLFERDFPGEQLNYFDYEKIINFSSSVIIDILDRKYPINRIITLGFTKKISIGLTGINYFYITNISDINFIKL